MQHKEGLLARMAGSILISPNPGLSLKEWRKRIGIRQNQLARRMGISPSVLSDYESGRRNSPGIRFIRRYLECLIELDLEGGRRLNYLIGFPKTDAILAIRELERSIKASRLVKELEADVLVGEEMLDKGLYGYTVLDSVSTIYALSGIEFYQIFGATTERALIFTKVGLGRSPMVAIRVSHLKPRMVVLHGPKEPDRLGIELAASERIILAVSRLPNENEIIIRLSKL